MSSLPVRDPEKDHLLTPSNSTLIVIDYQPPQISDITSMDRNEMVKNVVALIKMAKLFKIPIVHSTVNVKTGLNQPPVPQVRQVTKDLPSYDRTSINAWEDKEFNEAVKATGRKKLIMAALWSEACLSFPTLDALKEGYEVYLVVDAVGGTSLTAHEAALRRLEKAGAQPVSVIGLISEIQRDWARTGTIGEELAILSELGGVVGFQMKGSILEKELEKENM
ncbi:MAG TPA: hydrolase [Bacteroidia bacterium]|jgi:nicotinamidase-related amidase|nr:hydrolase [Bacteroidia bacterium]